MATATFFATFFGAKENGCGIFPRIRAEESGTQLP
jgi:hypothetical protein